MTDVYAKRAAIALERIADASEKATHSHAELTGRLDRCEASYRDVAAVNQTLHRRIAALHGIINKLKGAKP